MSHVRSQPGEASSTPLTRGAGSFSVNAILLCEAGEIVDSVRMDGSVTNAARNIPYRDVACIKNDYAKLDAKNRLSVFAFFAFLAFVKVWRVELLVANR
jgi:hypothetical protein